MARPGPSRGRSSRALSHNNIVDILMDDDESGDSDLEDLTGGDSGWSPDDDVQDNTLNFDFDDENNTVNQDTNTQDDTGLTDDDDSEDDEDAGDGAGVGAGDQERVRPSFSKRLVNGLDKCFEPENYDALELPSEKKEFSAVMEKKTRNKPEEEKITWRNYKVTRRGRQGRENVIQNPGGVHSAVARAADTPEKCFNVFFTPAMIRLCVDMTNLNIEKKITSLPQERQNQIRESDQYAWIGMVDELDMS